MEDFGRLKQDSNLPLPRRSLAMKASGFRVGRLLIRMLIRKGFLIRTYTQGECSTGSMVHH